MPSSNGLSKNGLKETSPSQPLDPAMFDVPDKYESAMDNSRHNEADEPVQEGFFIAFDTGTPVKPKPQLGNRKKDSKKLEPSDNMETSDNMGNGSNSESNVDVEEMDVSGDQSNHDDRLVPCGLETPGASQVRFPIMPLRV
jgi:hypothetical protein